MQDTISAIATPQGNGGVAIIRLSGDNALSIAADMFRPSKQKDFGFTPNVMYTGEISGEGFTDYGFCVYFKSPKSFTGEDCVEFHCHGGAQIARGILAKTYALGARPAEKGEFTRRAFLNGKITLCSAEGIIGMINAQSLAELRAGSMLTREVFSKKIKSLQDELKSLLAKIDANLDYPEESTPLDEQEIILGVESLNDKLEKLIKSYDTGKVIKEGVRVVICGKPNVGKSSLLNKLLGYERAIVDSEAGTTRDFIEGSISIGGVKFDFVDTAGIRKGASKAEERGIEFAKKIMRSADIILSLTDGGGEAETDGASGRIIRVFNKCDIVKPVGEFDVAVSAKTGEGIDTLLDLLNKSVDLGKASDGLFVIEARHYYALKRAKDHLLNAKESLKEFREDLLSVDLSECWSALGEITGETATEEIIAEVFDKFCVGK